MLPLPIFKHLEGLQCADYIHRVHCSFLADLCEHKSERELRRMNHQQLSNNFPAFITPIKNIFKKFIFKSFFPLKYSLYESSGETLLSVAQGHTEQQSGATEESHCHLCELQTFRFKITRRHSEFKRKSTNKRGQKMLRSEGTACYHSTFHCLVTVVFIPCVKQKDARSEVVTYEK